MAYLWKCSKLCDWPKQTYAAMWLKRSLNRYNMVDLISTNTPRPHPGLPFDSSQSATRINENTSLLFGAAKSKARVTLRDHT